MAESLAHMYSLERTLQELSNEYQLDRVKMDFKNLCFLVLWTKVASALEGLTSGSGVLSSIDVSIDLGINSTFYLSVYGNTNRCLHHLDKKRGRSNLYNILIFSLVSEICF